MKEPSVMTHSARSTVRVKHEKNERAKAKREKCKDCACEADQVDGLTPDSSQDTFEDNFGHLPIRQGEWYP
jgi:hypothetical protein